LETGRTDFVGDWVSKNVALSHRTTTYIHTYTSTYIHTYIGHIHTYKHAYIRTYIHTCRYAA
jgi:hypothetical protein